FVLRPRADLSLARFLLRFALACRRSRFEEGARALLALDLRTIELYESYEAEGLDLELRRQGLVVAARTERALAEYRELARLLRRLGYAGRIDDLDAASLAEPALDGRRLAGGLHAHLDVHVRPEKLVASLHGSLRAAGVEVREHFRVASLRRAGSGWAAS